MKNLLLIDANALIHRAYHALPPLSSPDGQATNAIYGLSSLLLKILKNSPPDYVAAAFDRPEPTFRKEAFKEYKAHRPPAEENLISQIIAAHELFEVFGIKSFEKAGFEADDVIGSLAAKFQKIDNLKIIILTGDLDTLQLVDGEKTVVQTLKKGVSETFIYDEKAVIARYNLKPDQMTDYRGLVGDASDNLSGVKGIGPKTAEKLINEFGNLENIFRSIKKDHPFFKKIDGQEETAIFFKKMATIKKDIPLDASLESLCFEKIPEERIIPLFRKLGFQSLIERMVQKQKPETIEMFSEKNSEELFFVNGEVDLKASEISDKQKIKVAYDWHEIFDKNEGALKSLEGSVFDFKVAAWLIDPDNKVSRENISKNFLNGQSFNDPENEKKLFFVLRKKIADYGLEKIWSEVEAPLIPLISEIEKWGILINKEGLLKLKEAADEEINATAKKIYELAGETFNLNSPKQVSRILFEKMEIEAIKSKRTPGGAKSTAEEVLVKLKGKSPIINLILNYRETFKIKSTYFEPILEMIGENGRLRTVFNQTNTATGRLSSEKPNLQNIPQTSKWAPLLREVFRAPEGKKILSIDYSQIELRILAHIANDSKMKEAFDKNLDIHQATAAQIFKIPIEKVSPEMRRIGKTLNFGIVYGMGASAFAAQTGVSKAEAEKFIGDYFLNFPMISRWQEKVKEEAKTNGFITNENGRRRWFKELVSLNPRVLAEVDRKAMNTPIQSLGADIIKLAMIRSAELLKKKGWWGEKAKMLLSIHDELLFEIDDDILMESAKILRSEMENVQKISVPLKVEVKYGENWNDLIKI